MTEPTIWVHSADSHVMEPEDLWMRNLPASLAPRAPRTERKQTDRGERELIYIEDRVVRRDVPALFDATFRPPGARDFRRRLADLDGEGVWGELAFPSLGLWISEMLEPETAHQCNRVYNDWCLDEYMGFSPRFVGAACLSMLDTDDAVAELHRCAGLGFRAAFLAASPPTDRQFNDEVWDPLWAAAEEAGILIAFHIGTGTNGTIYSGRGGAVINYLETSFPGQRAVAHLTAAGVFDRHPRLRVLVAEGGAGWIPALGDRMDEAYRQHGMFVRPKLSMLPSEFLYRQVYTSFQHDTSAVPAVQAMGYQNVMWGSDYPHLEGTFPNTQETLRGLFGHVDAETTQRITVQNFEDLFDIPARPDAVGASSGAGTTDR